MGSLILVRVTGKDAEMAMGSLGKIIESTSENRPMKET